MTSGEIRSVLVVEDLAESRAWLEAAARSAFPGAEVTAVSGCRSAAAWIMGRKDGDGPAAALIDLGLPDGSGCELIRQIVEQDPSAVPVVVTVYDDDAHLFGAMAAGAQGYILKDGDQDRLISDLRRVVAGDPVMSPAVVRRLLQHFREAPTPSGADKASALTPRETEVLALIARGLRVGEAARLLGLTDHTVAGYVKGIYQKLNVSSRAEAALEASRMGLV